MSSDRDVRRLADAIARKIAQKKPRGVCYLVIIADVDAPPDSATPNVATRTDLKGPALLEMLKVAQIQVQHELRRQLDELDRVKNAKKQSN